jgi:hypothetical protein
MRPAAFSASSRLFDLKGEAKIARKIMRALSIHTGGGSIPAETPLW